MAIAIQPHTEHTQLDRWSTRPRRLVTVSTYPPRRCGLAGFTANLCEGLATLTPQWQVTICAIDRDGLSYDSPVLVTIHQDRADDYRRAADEIADAGCDLVLIQHEFGIFGGRDGSYICALATRLAERGVRYALTLHTVLSRPSAGQRSVLRQLCRAAALVTVFTPTARVLLAEHGIADPDTVVVVPHGAPTVLRTSTPLRHPQPVVAEALDRLADASVLTTFGLLGPGKGIEVALSALPLVVARHPEVRYVVAGTTHPEEARMHGDAYREQLIDLAATLGVAEHVLFLDAFLTDPELGALLARTSIYLTPCRSADQACSGALTFAIAAGCPVVSTRYRYAEDLLAVRTGHTSPGRLVACNDADALAEAINGLLDDPVALARAREAAGNLGAALTWPAVAQRLVRTLTPVLPALPAHATRRDRRHPKPPSPAGAGRGPALTAPPLCLDHLDRLTLGRTAERRTDGVGAGIIQFARGGEPDLNSGFCVDDVARLGIVAAGLAGGTGGDGRPGAAQERALRWSAPAVRFIEDAVGDHATGLRNLRRLDGQWGDQPHLGDHVGRAVWSLGVIAGGRLPESIRRRAALLLERLLPAVSQISAPRSAAYSALGLASLPRPSAGVRRQLREIGDRLHAAVREQPAQWRWFEPRLTYDNARLPQALLAAGQALRCPQLVSSGLDALDWYLGQVGLDQRPAMLSCVGNRWRCRGEGNVDEGHIHEGDEQPLDAAATVEALVIAHRVTQTSGATTRNGGATRSSRYAQLAVRGYEWFHGANRAGISLYDSITGGCRDGLRAASANVNMGAESTLAYYQALFALAGAGLIRLSPPLWQPTGNDG